MAVVLRLHNIGKSGWWSLLTLVPVANLYLYILCLSAPTGYKRTKKLDTPAKVNSGDFRRYYCFDYYSQPSLRRRNQHGHYLCRKLKGTRLNC